MVRTTASRSMKAHKPPTHDTNGRHVHNKILRALPKEERAVIFAKLEFVSLPVRTLLQEVGFPIKHAFFMK